MFDGIGFSELLLIGILGLVVLGPERLPIAVRTVSGWIRTMKRMANSVKDELEQELKLEELQANLKKAEQKGLGDLSPELQDSLDQLKEAAQAVNRPYDIESSSPFSKNPPKLDSTSSTPESAPASDSNLSASEAGKDK
ncbi:Sec-independent protein translocase subunit TatB [Shewanella avicenniae]|uniref:Sec-independent protein translocase protein TatB n=1 Tax=Shewanella avicenniae TaxID=2814294 RepID=A0ABX7QR67_9GAMM|nr:Sec-independent protein translocase protein TatB [Shewanella avicenniae]QSX33373.1 Sec-independent protein translocase subunit TatB [Shewanella avicenniae]